MARKKNSAIAAAARMREAKVTRNQTKPTVEDSSSASDTEPDVDMCCWDGSVNHVPSSDEEPMGFDTDAEGFSDLDGEELVASIEEEMKWKGMPLPLAIIMQSTGNVEVWSSAERNRRRRNTQRQWGNFCGYLSDNEPDDLADDECNTPEVHPLAFTAAMNASLQGNLPTSSSQDFRIAAPPPLKRRKLDVPFRVARSEAHGERRKKVFSALKDIEKVLKSKKTEFHAGNSGLEAMRMRAIRSYLHMVVLNYRLL
ncbi:hypothetical protein PLEOSDRAFT_1104556 [Pleurotus ostreatus PC15]|uniref:Uncharacterized protein n=1 Tax=Pleurotus ostreatus (strain PC15) TaxID=1137138 RepID=A0A067NIQ0_PLEO1|nr:hypothetical protein PLEOSDRAFT_1104556 [Pleurotus ostreatus PC15]